LLFIVAQQLQASVFYLLRSGFGAEASKSGLSSFGVGNVTVSVIRIPGLSIIIIESVFGLICSDLALGTALQDFSEAWIC